jgi:hypothetical protein
MTIELRGKVMTQFYGRIEGNRRPATRLGSKESGLVAEARGWNIGGEVVITHIDGKDVVRFYKTSGSIGLQRRELIAEFSE